MDYLRLILMSFIAIMTISEQASSVNGCRVKFLVALPYNHRYEPTYSWERQREILSGAEFAVERINNISECKLQLTAVINSGQCGKANNYNFLETVLAQLQIISLYNETVASVGILCDSNEFQFVAQPPLVDVKDKLEAAISFPNPVRPATALIKALFSYMKSLNWQKIGVITETQDTHFSRTAEALYRNAKNEPNIDIIMYEQVQVRARTFPSVSKITFLSTSLTVMADILCKAHQKKLVWPKYVWILHSYLLIDIINLETPCFVNKALENVLLIRERRMDPLFDASKVDFDGLRRDQLNSSKGTQWNPFSTTLYNLVWKMAIKLKINEDKMNISLPEHRTIIEVTQLRNGKEILIATISNDSLTFADSKILDMEISDELQVKFEGATTTYTIIFSTAVFICFILVTVMLIGYIYFRNEPEIKSTSYILSLLIFLGCYLNLIFVSLLLYFYQPMYISNEILNIICGILPWISGLGISTALIIATVLVKLARVYHIFNKFNVRPLGRMSSDFFLAVYVLLILSPLILILTVWALVDRFKITFPPALQVGFIQKQCLSDYLNIWITLLVLYTVILFMVVVVIAVRSRKIREKNFKDTKKVNMFIFCLFFDILLPLSVWWLLENIGTAVSLYVSAIPLHIGHFGIILLCQLLLFFPKILGPLSRLMKELNKTKTINFK